jgi:hypothetical protein
MKQTAISPKGAATHMAITHGLIPRPLEIKM